ncbi:hypothetical protein JMJ77_0005917 [Colletotrichum scovillei]|uniref:Uncharacterized protein n=1 Tax=Colletotrichum scovillei TaxID=1209932 RepID=A0A9P7RJW1_9PEZI|nr:hypothetical protein JMJ77_0005917 [Colletotrichum scovillei]KAG7077145.1 hypothetical protein JMJ76_0014397 [Colletotrichum scovillei]KAG7084256.1 hypothetical protein JMJ78_0009694 [Colletotrichum scovillei]
MWSISDCSSTPPIASSGGTGISWIACSHKLLERATSLSVYRVKFPHSIVFACIVQMSGCDDQRPFNQRNMGRSVEHS